MKIPEQVKKLREEVNCYKISQLLITAEDLGIFKLLSEGITDINKISENLEVQKSSIQSLLNGLVCHGFIMKRGDSYGFHDDFVVLDPKHSTSQNGYIRYADEIMHKWINLKQVIRNPEISAKNFQSITGADPIVSRSFINAMHVNGLPQASYIAQNYDFSNHQILDIGAGSGVYSTTVLKNHLSVSSVILELPNIVPICQEYVNNSGCQENVKIVSGSYHDSLPESLFDDIFLFAVIHQEGEAGLTELLKKIKARLKPQGRLFLTSFFLNEDRISPSFSVMFSIEMLLMTTEGKVYTHNEINHLLQQASLSNITRIDDIPGPSTLYLSS